MSKLKVTTISDPANDNTAFTVDSAGDVTFVGNVDLSGVTVTGISSYADADALTLFNASGSAPVYACRAWVNINGWVTPSIRASGNVSSITDNGTGRYTVNLTTSMPDANYCCQVTTSSTNNANFTGGGDRQFALTRLISTGSVQIEFPFDGGSVGDVYTASVSIFR